MSKAFPDIFYHSLSQARLKDSVAKGEDALRGISRFHLDPERRNPGVWISDSLPFLVERGYGNEQSDETIGDFKIGDETISVQKPVLSIVLQLEGIDEGKILQHPLLLEQFFHIGDIPWANVKNMLIREHDEDAEKTARDVAARLKKEFEVEIGIQTFPRNIGFEGKWEEKSQESDQPNLNKIVGEKRSENKGYEINSLPKDGEINRF